MKKASKVQEIIVDSIEYEPGSGWFLMRDNQKVYKVLLDSSMLMHLVHIYCRNTNQALKSNRN